MKTPFLIGEKVYLRGIEEADLNEVYLQWFNDAEVCQHNSHHRFPNTKEEMESYFKTNIQSPVNLVLAIVDKKTDQHIGNVSLQSINWVDRSAEYAIIIGDKNFWGGGYGREASTLIMDHGFAALNLHRIYCGTSEENTGMQKLGSRLGFVKEGVSREAMWKNGAYRNLIQYGVLRHEYEQKKTEQTEKN